MPRPASLRAWGAIAALGYSTAAALVAAPGAAQPVAEPDSGLAVTPPPGYETQLLAPNGPYAAMILVQRRDVRDVGCWIGFQTTSDTVAPSSQEEINQRAASGEWAERVRASFAGRKNVLSLAPFEHTGVHGTAVVYDDGSSADASPPGADRTLMVMLETPKGRTNVICVAKTSAFDARRPEFEAIVRAITLPR